MRWRPTPGGKTCCDSLKPNFLEVQLQRQLTDARCGCPRDLAERRRSGQPGRIEAGDAARVQELRVIEQIEELSPELQIEALGDGGVFEKRKVPVVDSGAVEEAAVRIAFGTERGRTERQRAEILAAGFARVGDIEWADEIRRVCGKRDRTTEAGALERLVVGFDHRDGKASGETRDAADGPAVSETFGATQLIDRELVAVAGDELVRAVERGKSAAEAGVERIDLLAVAGGVIERFAEGVSD